MESFEQKYAVPLLQESLQTLEHEYKKEKEKRITDFKTVFTEYFQTLTKENTEDTGLIAVSLLRTSLWLHQKGEYQISAYDENLTPLHPQLNRYYDGTWCLKHMLAMYGFLEPHRKKYVGKITPADMRGIVLQNIRLFTTYVEDTIYHALKQLKEENILTGQTQNKEILIAVGDFISGGIKPPYLCPVSVTGHDPQNEIRFSIYMENKQYEKISCHNYQNIQARDLTVSGMALTVCGFYNCVFTNLNCTDAKLNRVIFSNCGFQNVDFSRSHFKQTDFINCTFKETIFSQIQTEETTGI